MKAWTNVAKVKSPVQTWHIRPCTTYRNALRDLQKHGLLVPSLLGHLGLTHLNVSRSFWHAHGSLGSRYSGESGSFKSDAARRRKQQVHVGSSLKAQEVHFQCWLTAPKVLRHRPGLHGESEAEPRSDPRPHKKSDEKESQQASPVSWSSSIARQTSFVHSATSNVYLAGHRYRSYAAGCHNQFSRFGSGTNEREKSLRSHPSPASPR